MGNSYRPVSDRAKALFGDDLFDADFAPAEERDHLAGGHLEVVARPYRVLADNFTGGTQGDVVDLALPAEVEGALLAGGFLERSEPPKQDDEPSPALSRKRSK